MTVWILCFLNAVNMSVWLFLAFIDFSRQRQFWLLPVPQILHFVNGSDCLPGFPTHPTLCTCRLSGISCAVWLYVGDWTAVGGVCFVFMSRGTLTILLIPVEGTPGAATWQKTLFSLHQLRPGPPDPLLLIFSTFYGFPGWPKVMRLECGKEGHG